MNIYYRNLGSAKQVTGSCHLIQIKNLEGIKDTNIIVDMGQVQDGSLSTAQLYKINGRPFPIDFKDIDAICITHSHADHCCLVGRLPALGYEGDILTTELSLELYAVNLRDGAFLHIKELEAYNKKRKGKQSELQPLYTPQSVETMINRTRGYSFNQEVIINEKVKIQFLPSGHLSGASMIEVTIQDEYDVKRLLFSGDTSGLKSIPFTKTPDLTKKKYHAIWSESTYGDRLIPKSNPIEELTKHIQDTCINYRKSILIPVFSIGRSTNMLYYLKETFENNPQFKDIPIYLCSPMACTSHNIIGRDASFDFYDDKWKEHKDLWKWGQVEYITSFEQVGKLAMDKQPKILCASSGMLTGGYSNYFMTKMLPKKHQKLLFCGYQGVNTNGRVLLDGVQKSITVEEDGKKISLPIKADIAILQGMSGHADYRELIELYSQVEKKKLKYFILTHGDETACKHFKNELNKSFKNTEVKIPNYGELIKIL